MSLSAGLSAAHTAQDVISALNLTPHPEKGWYIETYRDPHNFTDTSNGTSRSRSPSTNIYYLLEGESGLSHWHRVLDAVEVWHYYAGAPLQLSLSWDDGSPVRDLVLGPDIWNGQRPQIVVERGEWQHALSLGDWTLVGCSVAPAFEFEGFEMAQPGWEPKGAEKKEEGEKA
ncbi:RmlC-like cupin domain-containing protein [Aspergillus nidulans var. acristatus]|jgi:predicted cupin superfamily sugar epimerase